MDRLEVRQILLKLIEKNLSHPDYPRVTDLADHYRKLITGKKIDSLLKRFNPRESEDMFKQRVALTIATSPAVSHSAMKPFYKIPKSTPLTAKVKAKKDIPDPEKIEEEITERFQKFYGTNAKMDGVDYFLQSRFMELSFMDPNSWVVIEFDPFDPLKEKAYPRPFEVSSAMAKNFSIVNNEVKWLHVEQEIEMIAKDKKPETGKKHTLYTDQWAVVFEQTLKKGIELGLTSDQELIEIEDKHYIISYFDHKIGKVPAFRIGYFRDLETDGRTFVNPLHPAMCHFDKSIKQVSEYDLSTALHTFPQKIVRLVKSCPGVIGDPNGICRGGSLVDGTTCPTCAGTGKPIHTSGQDIVEVELPENIKEDGLMPLSEMVYYVPLPIELLKFQKETVDELAIKVHQSVFNTTVLIKKDGQVSGDKTAFEVDNDMESVYDALSSFSDNYSAKWMAIAEFIAILTDNQEKVSWMHRMPANLKLKTRERLYAEYDQASKSNMPAFVIDAITDELSEAIFMDDADELLKYRVKKQYSPFRGKTKDEVMMLLASDDVLKETKILYNYFEDIFQTLEAEYAKKGKDFYLETQEVRKKNIDDKVAEYITKIKDQQPAAFKLPTGPVDDNPEA